MDHHLDDLQNLRERCGFYGDFLSERDFSHISSIEWFPFISVCGLSHMRDEATNNPPL
jgi:hypothetical protein